MPNSESLPVACNRDCGATCALIAESASDGSLRLTRNPLNHEFKTPCPRGLRALESRNAPDRLKKPLLRTGKRGSGSFEEVSWETALSAAAEGLLDIKSRFGAEAILDFGGSGACSGALHNTNRLTSAFLGQLGPVTRMNGNYSFQAAAFALPYVYGSKSVGYDARTLLDTRFVILWGANISDTRFGNETEQVIRRVKAAGGELVVIDPRRTRTARNLGTQWIPVRPGGDAALMLAIAFVLLSEGLTDSDYISLYVHGSEDFFGYVSGKTDGVPKTPEWASRYCDVPPSDIQNLARRYAAARPAALVPGYSLQRAMGGEETVRLAATLQAITGNAGVDGGTPGTNMWFGPGGPEISVFKGSNGNGATIPKATWPLGILGGKVKGYSADIKAAYMVGNNYINQGSDIGANIAAFNSLEFVVCHELFMTPSAAYADVIFPATHYLEREDVITSEENYLYYSARVLDPIGEARDDFDIFNELSGLMGFGSDFSEGRSSAEWVDWIIDNSAVGREGRDRFKKTGIFDGGDHQRNGLESFIRDPGGNPLDTPSGKIEISSERYTETGFPAWPEYRPLVRDEKHLLMLITPHSRYRINGTGSNIPWVKEKDPIVLWMNPEDAQQRDICDGDSVRVHNDVGNLELKVRITPDIAPGVVSCIQGGWQNLPDSPSVNNLTPLEPTLPSIGTRTHTVFVEVEPVRIKI